MTTFYFVRHGHRALTVGDPPLSGQGIAQARSVAAHLRRRPIVAVYASPLRRAHETAQWIARAHNLKVVADARLRERMNWGDVEAQSFEDFSAQWQRCTRERDYRPPGGDSARAAGARAESFIREQAERHPQREVVAVLHGGVLTDFLLNVFDEAELNRWHPDFIAQQSQLVPECSITVIEFDGHYTMRRFAEVTHLPQHIN